MSPAPLQGSGKISAGLQEWGRKPALLEDEVELEMAAGAPRDAPCEVAKGSH